MTFKGSLCFQHPCVKAILGHKKPSPVKIGPKTALFQKFKGINIKYSYRDPEKAHPWLKRIFRRNPFRGVGCSELQEPKKALKTSDSLERVEITYLGSENPKTIATKFCVTGAVHDIITHANFCEDR